MIKGKRIRPACGTSPPRTSPFVHKRNSMPRHIQLMRCPKTGYTGTNDENLHHYDR